DLVAGQQEPPETQRVAELGRLGRGVPGALAGRYRLQFGDTSLEVPDERPGDRVGRGQRALGQRRQAQVADPDLQEGRREGGFDLVGMEVQLVRADTTDADVEDEVGVCHAAETLDQG